MEVNLYLVTFSRKKTDKVTGKSHFFMQTLSQISVKKQIPVKAQVNKLVDSID